MNTELQEVIRLGKEYNLIPIVRCLLADTETPIRVFQHVAEEKRAFLLESVEGGIKWARYSFIGTDPFLIIRARDGKTHLETQGRTVATEEKPLEALKSQLALFRSPSIEGLPRFTGGAVGFFGYDLLQYYENLPKHRVDDIQMDDIQFMFCDQVIAFDHFKQQMNVIANVHIPDGASEETIAEAYRQTCQKLDATIQKLKKPLPSTMMTHSEVETTADLSGFRSNLSKEQYVSNVKAAQEYIKAGDIFQVVLSQRFETDTDVSPLQVYRVLRTLNPSPYMYYLKMDDEIIVGTSPEMLVRVEDERVDTRAIAGTRPRGKTPEHDLELEQDLLADQKERAEHLMLVDLVRNDVGRVAEYGTVSCDSFMQIERYSHVMHIVSNVSGTMNKEKDFFDAFLSCLPAGTVSGAPKLRAMEIIAEFENEKRGTYSGAIGYLGFSGNMDSAITIRTIVFKNGKAYIQAGAGVVFDSDPEKEYEETVNKARGMMTAIRTAEAMFRRAADNPNLDYYVHVPAL
ncbi:anthranilate synthase component I [Paenibacillus chitinolyticus]|uniref:anthranilate synthase component I n=1 Tax=Paenibacillus chitinolyticus TaxID=79263 RepID=UPI0026E4BA4E|nr:anthranilate synthase component I [Paenibacillus chitinolyticus]GKS11814.1 anthranilate synthase component I [Paenibacillus chitinolyticus]